MLTGIIVGIMIGAGASTTPPIITHAINMGYPACRTEDDQTPCYWDAKARGNGKGRSFVWTGDEILYGYSK